MTRSYRRSLSLAVLLGITAAAGAADPPGGRVDRLGDPLPDGAFARLGTARFRALGYAAALSPDGKTLAVCTDCDAIGLLDTATGREVRRIQLPGVCRIAQLVFAPDGGRLLAGDAVYGVRWFDVASGKRLGGLEDGVRNRRGLALSADGKALAVGSDHIGQQTPVRVFDAESGKKRGEFTPDQDIQGGVALSGDGKRAATWGRSLHDRSGANVVQLWDVATGKEERRVVVGTATVGLAALSPDGRLLAVWEDGGTLSSWDAATGKELRRWAVPVAEAGLFGFSPDGKVLYAGTSDGLVRLWDRATGRRLPGAAGPACSPFGLAFLPDGKVLAAGLDQQAVRLWDVATGRERTPCVGHRAWVAAVAFAADGRSLLSAGPDGLRRWDLPTGTELRHLVISADERFGDRDASTLCTALSPDSRFATCGERHRGALRLVDTASGRDLFGVPPDERYTGAASAYSADGGRFAVLRLAGRGNGARVRLLDIASGEMLRSVPAEDGASGSFLALSSDGRLLAVDTLSVGRGNEPHSALQVWDADSGTSLWALEGACPPGSRLAFSPDGAVLAIADDLGVRLYDAARGIPLREFKGGDGFLRVYP